MNSDIWHQQVSPVQTEKMQEFIIFSLGGEVYGLDILKVQEIRNYDAVTKIANTPEFIKGVMNLRGIIVPIVDLRIKFNLGNVKYDQFTIVIILNISGRTIGVVVDSVSEVMAFVPSEIRAVPDIVVNIETNYITGLVTVNGQLHILVDIELLMNSHEMALVDTLSLA